MSSDYSHNIGRKINRGLAWLGLGSTVVGVLDALSLFFILRYWVGVEDFGVATLAVTLFPIIDVITEMGLTAAIIQRDDHSPGKLSTLFWLNAIVSAAAFAVVLGLAPLLGALQDSKVVGYLLIAYGSKLLFQNVYFMPIALMRRELRFKELQLIRVVANFGEFAVKVSTAALGFGVWCFVFGPLTRVFLTGVGAQICYPWWPRFVFRLGEVRAYVIFGMKNVASEVLFFFYTNIDYQVVGYFFGKSATGLYRAGHALVAEPLRFLREPLVQVALSGFSRLKLEPEALKHQFFTLTRLTLALMLPLVAVFFVAAEEILEVLLPDYQAASPVVRIFCFVGLVRVVGFIMEPYLDGLGYAGRRLVAVTFATLFLPLVYVAFAALGGSAFGYTSVALAWAAGFPVVLGLILWMVSAVGGFTIGEYLRRTVGVCACAVVAVGVGMGAKALIPDGGLGLRLLVGAGLTIAVQLALMVRFLEFSPRDILKALRAPQAA
jgi:O-antigen/teichoic acid export membrane protein